MSSLALACWARFRASHPAVGEDRLYEVFHFGDSQELADALGALVVSGRKRATASALWTYEHQGRRPPQPGDMSVVTRWSGQPLCVIETTHVEIVPFAAVSAGFAAAEGEGDGSLAHWREAHRAYFERECANSGKTVAQDMPIVCEQFRLVDLAQDA